MKYLGRGVGVGGGGGGGSPAVEGSLITITSGSPTTTIVNGVNYQKVLLENTATVILPTQTSLHNLSVELIQDGTGNRSVTFEAPSGYTLTYNGTGSTAPGINLLANKRTKFAFEYTTGSTVIDASQYFFEG